MTEERKNDGVECVTCGDEDVRIVVVDTQERKILAMACEPGHLADFMASTRDLGERRYVCGVTEALDLVAPLPG